MWKNIKHKIHNIDNDLSLSKTLSPYINISVNTKAKSLELKYTTVGT